MKKVFCLMLALLMLAPSAAYAAPAGEEGAPVLPEEAPGGEESASAAAAALEITGEVEVPEEVPSLFSEAPVISVSVPDTGWVLVNPYGLEVEREGLITNQQVVSPAMVLENQSTVPVRVDARAVGTVPAGSEAVFAADPPGEEAADKEVFLFLEFQSFWGNDALWSGRFTDAANQLAVSPLGAWKQGVMTMDAGGRGALRVFGSAAVNTALPWTGADTVNITVAFTFTPAEDTPAYGG